MKYSKLCACVSDVMRNHEGSRRYSNKRSGWVAECVIVFVRFFSVCLCRLSLVFQTVSLGRGGCPVMDPISSILLTTNTFITARDLGDDTHHLPASNRNPRKVPTTRLVSSSARGCIHGSLRPFDSIPFRWLPLHLFDGVPRAPPSGVPVLPASTAKDAHVRPD